MAFSLRSSEAAVMGVLCFGGEAGSTAIVCTGEKGQARGHNLSTPGWSLLPSCTDIPGSIQDPNSLAYLQLCMCTKVGGTRCFWYFLRDRVSHVALVGLKLLYSQDDLEYLILLVFNSSVPLPNQNLGHQANILLSEQNPQPIFLSTAKAGGWYESSSPVVLGQSSTSWIPSLPFKLLAWPEAKLLGSLLRMCPEWWYVLVCLFFFLR